MEPRIQYAQTEDGVSIAYWTMGEGMPLIIGPPLGWGHIALECQFPELMSWYERLARHRKVVRFDGRNQGLSERGIQALSEADFAADVEAVVERIGLDQADLMASAYLAPPMLRFAAERRDVVRRLVLMRPIVRGRDVLGQPRMLTLVGLIESDWELFTETWARNILGWSGDEAHEWAIFLRRAATQEDAARMFAAAAEMDATQWLDRVSAPTLLILDPPAPGRPEGAQTAAASIPDAQLVQLGRREDPFRSEAATQAIEEFLEEGEKASESAPPAPSGLITILFTDMQSSTALRRKLGDAKVQELVRAHNQIVRDALKTSGGREIKHTGDGIMASFSTATSALRCGIDIQRGVATHVEEHPGAQLGVYVGLNAGEPIAENGPDGRADLFGTSVDLARRICDHAEPGQILASNVVRELSEGKGFLFGDIGDVVPKGFEQPVRLYEVKWQA